MRYVEEVCSDTVRAVGRGECVLLRKPPNLRALCNMMRFSR